MYSDSVCADCALRLFNKLQYNLTGIGNAFSGNCIVVPNVDYAAYKGGDMSFSDQVKVIEDILLSSTGDVLQSLYVVPLIRCNESISCELDKQSYSRCLTYFADDVRKYNFRNILLLGSAATRFMNIKLSESLDTCYVSRNGRRYCVNYSPLVKFVDKDRYAEFVSNLRRWFYACNSDFNNYKHYVIR